MASQTIQTNLNIIELSRNVTVTLKLNGMREWTMRVRLGSLLLRFALWVLPFGVEIETDN